MGVDTAQEVVSFQQGGNFVIIVSRDDVHKLFLLQSTACLLQAMNLKKTFPLFLL